MLSDHSLSSTNRCSAPKLCNSFSNGNFSDVGGDITISIDGTSFLLHKIPLVSHSGKIRKMVASAYDSGFMKLELTNFPGGCETFELATKFCYGMNFEITTTNVAHLRCAAEYLGMTDDYCEDNLIARMENYLIEIVFQSLDKSVEVLSFCEALLPVAEEVRVVDRCVDAIVRIACKEQLVSSLSRLDCGSGPIELKVTCLDWWVEDISVLNIDFYHRVVAAMVRSSVRTNSIIASLMHYAQTYLKGIEKTQFRNPARTNMNMKENGQKVIVETLVSLLPTEKSSSIPLNFLFGMLRMATMLDATMACLRELERRISFRLEMVSLDDLLIPSLQNADSLFDVDTVLRIVVHFLQRVDEEEHEDSGYESEGNGSPSRDSMLNVGRLIDAYLAEIGADPYLSLQKFIAIIELLPDYARVIDDGLYRAVDIYLKAHPMLSEHECNKLCKFIDCQKLSQEACNHAAQNDRLPVQMVVRVLYFEQLSLKDALSGSSGDGFMLQKLSSGVVSSAMSPRDTYASLRRENRELKLEISRMRMRLSDLEKEQAYMKQGMMDKSANPKTLLHSLSRGIGRMGIFSNQAGGKQMKSPNKKTKEVWEEFLGFRGEDRSE